MGALPSVRFARLALVGVAAGLIAGCRSGGSSTATPITHLVVIFDENISFDHYFGTYPHAANAPGEPEFHAAPGTPQVNGLTTDLLTKNPNFTNPENGEVASNPFRLSRSQAATSSQSHDYAIEQMAYHGGAADLFPRHTGRGMFGGTGAFFTPAQVMGYYDGNTVTALWNYAQRFAMSDNAYSDQYGPSTPGAINLISGQTNGVTVKKVTYSTYMVDDGRGGKTLVNDIEPLGDICSIPGDDEVQMTGKNIGDLLTAANVRWGWFEGGFDLSTPAPGGALNCTRRTLSKIAGSGSTDYLPHHEPFQYYASTANPTHARPSSIAAIGSNTDGANHQYDLRDFFAAVQAGNYPAVSYLKASAFQDGHAGYSDPLDEQTFLVQVLNFLQARLEWRETAVIILYDDSDGWYDHQMAPVGNASFSSADRLHGMRACGVKGVTPQLPGVAGRGPVDGRCGPGTRQPFLVISRWAKVNYVDHTLITQSSVLKFIEDNWLHGTRIGGGSFDASAGSIDGLLDFHGNGAAPVLFLDEGRGTPVEQPAGGLPQ
ncbi:MAG TPA: alkaline phosphatase family protein [Vicinamibacterales bacterium]|nr:alkaline phosphatase family protein [Vicinamibacterales bacterium]